MSRLVACLVFLTLAAGGPGCARKEAALRDAFVAYRQQVLQAVMRQWRPPKPEPGLHTSVDFAIAADGGVHDVRMAESSGDRAFDDAALEAVRTVAATGLEPPPSELAQLFHHFRVEFHGARESAR